jgi:hypothetical protein
VRTTEDVYEEVKRGGQVQRRVRGEASMRPQRDPGGGWKSRGGPRMQLVSSQPTVSGIAAPAPGDPLMVSSPTRVRSAREVRARVGRLIDSVREGRLIHAVREFYSPAVETSNGAMIPMCGLASGAGRGWSNANPDAEWRRFEVNGVGVNGDTSFVECVLEFESTDGSVFSMEQVAVAQWRDGVIVKECLLPIHSR